MRPRTRVVLVTGAAGFLGRRVAAELGAEAHVLLLDRPGSLAPASGAADGNSVAVFEGDTRDREALVEVMARHGVTHVVHCAAIAGVASVAADLYTATTVNISGSVAVLDAAHQTGVERVVDASSEEVYGAPGFDVIGEDCPLTPISAYGLHKATVERLAEYWVEQGLDYIAARMSWVYGPGFPRDRLPSPWLHDAAEGRESRLDAGGDHRIDLVYVDDAARALVALLYSEDLRHRAYNVGQGVPTTLYDVASTLHRLRTAWTASIGPGTLSDLPERPALSVERIRADTGWVARIPLAAGLTASLEAR